MLNKDITVSSLHLQLWQQQFFFRVGIVYYETKELLSIDCKTCHYIQVLGDKAEHEESRAAEGETKGS